MEYCESVLIMRGLDVIGVVSRALTIAYEDKLQQGLRVCKRGTTHYKLRPVVCLYSGTSLSDISTSDL